MRNVRRLSQVVRPGPLAGVFVLVLALSGIVGCATVGREFPTERVVEIQIDQTTKSDLLAHFGRPYRRGIEDGDSTWTYVYYKLRLLGGQTQARDLYIRFNNETVNSYTYNFDVP
jgi:hypothetical protein